MAESRTYRNKPVRGKQERKAYIRKTNLKKSEEARSEEQMLTGMIRTVAEEAEQQLEQIEERQAEDELSLTGMIQTMTEEAMEKTEQKPVLQPKVYIEVTPPEEPKIEKKHGLTGKLVAICLLLTGLIVVSYFAGYLLADRKPYTAAVESTEKSEPALEPEETDLSETEDTKNELDDLQQTILTYVSSLHGNWSVYVKDLKTGESFAVNEAQLESASLIKLFTAGRYLEAVENGEIAESRDSAYWLQAMISWSDNDAWEMLETYIGNGDYISGMMSVTDFAQRFGCVSSGRNIGAETVYDEAADNLTTVSEIGKVLEAIYNGTYVSSQASQRIYELMKAQQYIYKIPAGLPEGFTFASKSGELTGVENDAAIICGPDTDYILVVISNGVYDESAAADIIEISRICALALNPSVNQ